MTHDLFMAIDPGNEQSAYVFYDGQTIVSFGKVPNIELLDLLRRNTRLTHICIEMVACYGMAVGKTIFDTCLVIGKVQEICDNKNIKCTLIYRKDVKMHLCGQTKAKDSNIIQALKDRFGEKGTKKAPGFFFGFKSDIWQAFAIAVFYNDTRNKNVPNN